MGFCWSIISPQALRYQPTEHPSPLVARGQTACSSSMPSSFPRSPLPLALPRLRGRVGRWPRLVHRGAPRSRKPRGLTAGRRGICQEILAHHGALLSTPKGHQELLLTLRQRHIIWTNPLYMCPCRDRRCQRLLSTEALRQTAEDAVFEGSAMRRGHTHPAHVVYIGLQEDGPQ